MSALPTPDFEETRYFYYVEELRQFFVASGLTCGSPADILAFNNQLRTSAAFFDHMSSHVRAILFREGGSMPRAQLLEIVAVAIGGPEMGQPAQHFREPMRDLFAFVTGTMQRPAGPSLRSRGQVVSFPSEAPAEPAAEREADPLPLPPSLTLEAPSDSAAERELSGLPVAPTPLAPSRPPSLRNLLLVGAGVVVVAILLVLALRPRTSGAANGHAIPAYSAPATARHVKPSPYGEALSHAPRHHRAHPQTPVIAATGGGGPETAPENTQPAASAAQPANQ